MFKGAGSVLYPNKVIAGLEKTSFLISQDIFIDLTIKDERICEISTDTIPSKPIFVMEKIDKNGETFYLKLPVEFSKEFQINDLLPPTTNVSKFIEISYSVVIEIKSLFKEDDKLLKPIKMGTYNSFNKSNHKYVLDKIK